MFFIIENFQSYHHFQCTIFMIPVLSEKEFKKKFKILYEIGSGSYGKVIKAYDTEMEKIIVLKELSSDSTLNEIYVMQSLVGKNIVEFFSAFLFNNTKYICMEFCGLGSLDNKKQYMTQDILFSILNDVTSGLSIIHKNGKIHFDIKPQNILLSNIGEAKIADFGITRSINTITSKSMNPKEGTILYLPPEAFKSGKITTAIDIWALGITIFEMATGVPLKLTPYNSFNDWLRANPEAKIYGSGELMNKTFIEILKRMLNENPEKRPSAEQILNYDEVKYAKPLWLQIKRKIHHHSEFFWKN